MFLSAGVVSAEGSPLEPERQPRGGRHRELHRASVERVGARNIPGIRNVAFVTVRVTVRVVVVIAQAAARGEREPRRAQFDGARVDPEFRLGG